MKLQRNKLAGALFGAVAALLGFGQQAMAVGTDAGTVIGNTATIEYDVSGVGQTPIDAVAPTFVVDRVVNFTLAQQDSANTDVAPGEQDAVTLFVLENLGNSPLDLRLSAINLSGTTVNTTTDNADMDAAFAFLVANGDGSTGVPVSGDLDFVDGLPEGESVVIAVLADAPLTLTDSQVAHIELRATAADPGAGINPAPDGSLGADLAESGTDDPDAIETVFGDLNGDGFEEARDGYTVVAAALAVDKAATVVDDPVNTTAPFFAIPGATIEYAITLTNTGTATAENISISDTLTGELLFETANLPSGTGNVSIDIGGTVTYCTADVGDANGDGCTFDGTDTLTIAGSDSSAATQPAPINVGATPVIIRFRATIDAT